MFKISHYANSFISIEGNESSLVCDPWIGKTSDNAWYSYPIYNDKEINKKIFNSKFIYISHLHCDHLDFETLRKFKNKNLTFLIKKFKNGTLKKRLSKISKRIIEVEPFKKIKLNADFNIAIIPQILSNSNNLEDNINYDLDTSIIVQSNKEKTIFFNNVDTTIDLKILKKINQFVKKVFKKKIDIFCYALGAGSEYPQCFLNVNRNKEKKRIVKESLNHLSKFIKYLKPEFFFPAGGTYVVYGKYFNLNQFLAKPSSIEVEKKLKNLNCLTSNLIGGGSVSFNNNKISIIKKNKSNNNFYNNFIKKVRNKKYYYFDKNNKIDLFYLDNLFLKAKENYFKILEKKGKIKTKWDIKFKIYKNFEITKNCKLDNKKSKFLKTYTLKNFQKKTKDIFYLDCIIEYKLFKFLLLGKFPWNTSISGSTILFRRKPNKFNVDLTFSLNFLRI